MYKQINTTMDTIFIFTLERKWIFLLIKQRYNSDNLCRHFFEPEKPSPPPGPPPLQSSISQWQAHKTKAILGRAALCAPKGQRDADSSITSEETMDYSFLSLNSLLLQCIQEAQYIALQIGNGGSIPSILKAYGR